MSMGLLVLNGKWLEQCAYFFNNSFNLTGNILNYLYFDYLNDIISSDPLKSMRSNALRFVCKVLCNNDVCGSFIGEKGSSVNKIENQTRTAILVSKRGDFFPGTSYLRVISISGSKADHISAVVCKVVDLVERYSDRSSKNPQCVLAVSSDGAERLLARGGPGVRDVANRFPNLNINLQKLEEMKLNERYVEITSLLGNIDDVKDCANILIGIVCSTDIKQPEFNLIYPQKVQENTTCTPWYSKKSTSSSSSSPTEEIGCSIRSTWAEVTRPFRVQPIRKPNSKVDDECSIIEDGKVWTLCNGVWGVKDNYEVFDIRTNSYGQSLFVKIS